MHPTVKSVMINCGAPEYALRNNLGVDRRNIIASLHPTRRPISSVDQYNTYQKVYKQPIGAWLMVVGSKHDEDLAISAALSLMQRSVVGSLKFPQQYHRPRFWSVYGGNYDKLRQNPEYREQIGKVGMLVLSNIAENSSHEKLEKVRDLITMYRNSPCVVTVVGCDPLEFALDKLHMRPDKVLHLGRKKEITI